MKDLFIPFKGVFKYKKLHVSIDNSVFILHYKFTFAMLALFSTILACKKYIGNPIDCFSDSKAVPLDVLDMFCWVHSTYSVHKKDTEMEAFPGVSPITSKDETIRHHKYYQWLSIVLFIQAILFVVPHFIWTHVDRGRVSMIVEDVQMGIITEEKKEARLNLIVAYFKKNVGRHQWYFFYYVSCEFLNLLNIFCQIYFTDNFLNNDFISYGLEMIGFAESVSIMGPRERVFPKMAKCSFNKYGPSGQIQNIEGLCVLPVNNVSEKLYLIIWVWFFILAPLTVMNMIFRIVTMFSVSLRGTLLSRYSPMVSDGTLSKILINLRLGDFFLLTKVASNMDYVICRDFFVKLSEELSPSFPTSSNRA